MPATVASAAGVTEVAESREKIASGASTAAAMREASGAESCTSPAPAARAPSAAIAGAFG